MLWISLPELATLPMLAGLFALDLRHGETPVPQGVVALTRPSAVATLPGGVRGPEDPLKSAFRELIGSIPELPEGEPRAETLLQIGEAQAVAGDLEASRVTLRAALAAGMAIDDKEKRHGLGIRVALALQRTGEPEEAVGLLERLEVDISDLAREPRARCLVALAEARGALGDAGEQVRLLREALATTLVRTIFGRVRHQLVLAEARRGEVDAAFEALNSTLFQADQFVDMDRASILHDWTRELRGRNPTEVAMILDRAVPIARRLEPGHRGQALGSIARGWAESGDLEHARDLALELAELREPNGRDYAPCVLADIAVARHHAGDKAGADNDLTLAAELVAEMLPGKPRDHRLCDLASALAKTGQFEVALQCLDKLEEPNGQVVGTYGLILQAQQAAGDVEGARATAQRALEIAHAIPVPAGYSAEMYKVTQIGNAYAMAGDTEKSIRAYLELPPEHWPISTFALLARSRAEAEGVDSAIAAIQKLPEEKRPSAFRAIAEVQGEDGDIAGALAWIKTLTNPRDRASALSGLANGRARQDVEVP